jgi:hypothetical protein
VRPPFDPEQFARESESRLKVAMPAPRPAKGRPSPGAPIAADSGPDLAEIDAEEVTLDLDSVPLLTASREEVDWIDLPAEASALVAHVNGVDTVEQICAKAGVSAEDGAYLMIDLIEREVVRFR